MINAPYEITKTWKKVNIWNTKNVLKTISKYWLFIFMHLADAFIQSDLHCIKVKVSTFYQLLLSLGIEPMTHGIIYQLIYLLVFK